MHPVDREAERRRVQEAAQFVLGRNQKPPRVALLLGTGHTHFTERLRNRVAVVARDIPGYPVRHAVDVGSFVFGELAGVPVVVADAPLSAHEGFVPRDLAFPVWMLQAMGVELLVLSAGAASITSEFAPGDLALVEDHLNLSGITPLMGLLEDVPGPRFPDMTEPYSHAWRRRALEIGREAGFPCREGVLAFVSGPSLPTRAEYRFLRQAGANLVAMSVVPEVLAAVHAGLPVLAVLGVIQRIDQGQPRPASVEQMLDAAELAAPRLATVLTGLIERMAKG